MSIDIFTIIEKTVMAGKRRIALTSVPLLNHLEPSSAFRSENIAELADIPLVQPNNNSILPSKKRWDLMMMSLAYKHGRRKKRKRKDDVKISNSPKKKLRQSSQKTYRDMMRSFILPKRQRTDGAKQYRNNLRSMVLKKRASVKTSKNRKTASLSKESTLTQIVKNFPARNNPVKILPSSSLVSVAKRLPGAYEKLGKVRKKTRAKQKGGIIPLAPLAVPAAIGLAKTLGIIGGATGLGLGINAAVKKSRR